MTNGNQELQESLEEWNGLFTRHGLKINLEKTEVLHIGHQREELDIDLNQNQNQNVHLFDPHTIYIIAILT